jgi:TusA-related sulfurtransferase
MNHTCQCHRVANDTLDETQARICANDTVGDVVRQLPGAEGTMTAMGIDHCCGASLTLREAAAMAGVPIEALLAALGRPADTPATPSMRRLVLDVRGLEPPQPLLRVLQEVDRLRPGSEMEVRHDRRPILLYPQLDERSLVHETDEPEPGLVRILIRKSA